MINWPDSVDLQNIMHKSKNGLKMTEFIFSIQARFPRHITSVHTGSVPRYPRIAGCHPPPTPGEFHVRFPVLIRDQYACIFPNHTGKFTFRPQKPSIEKHRFTNNPVHLSPGQTREYSGMKMSLFGAVSSEENCLFAAKFVNGKKKPGFQPLPVLILGGHVRGRGSSQASQKER